MRALKVLTLAAAMACSPLASAAPTVTIDWQSGGSYGVFDPASGMPIGTISGPPPVGQVTTRAGRFLGEIVDTVGIGADEFYLSPDHFFAYCHDLGEVLSNSTYEVTVGASKEVLDFLGAVNAVLAPQSDSPYDWISPADKYIAGAVQLGIWEALYDKDFDLGSGSLTFGLAVSGTMNATMLTHYNSFVAAMDKSDALNGQYVMLLTNTGSSPQTTNRLIPGTQDVIAARYVPEGLVVPEPGTLLLLGSAVAAAAFTRRRS